MRVSAFPDVALNGINYGHPTCGRIFGKHVPQSTLRKAVIDHLQRNLTVYDSVDYYPSLVVSSIEPVLPHLHNLNRLRLHLATPLRTVLCALSALPFLHTLEIHGARLDGPPWVEAFLQLRNLTSLTMTVAEMGAEDLNFDDEFNNVADILTALAPRLSRLEIAGDLIDLSALAALEWPRLNALRLLNHAIPSEIHVPLSALVGRMPSLRILGCDFSAGAQPYCDPIIFGDDNPGPEIFLPDLCHLSISNVQPNDKVIHQLPRSLEILRVLAIRDNCEHRDFLSMNQCLQYRALSDAEAFRWIETAARLPHLTELALSLDNAPSPAILSAIASACPGLRTLELEQAAYEDNESLSQYSIEYLAQPLTILHDLRELRITLELGAHNRAPMRRTPAVFTDIKDRVEEAAQIFAQLLPTLEIIGILYCNDGLSISSAPECHSVWRRMQIYR
ncbi:hypothetical protein DXG03_009325, partial [Asterophora parasitica]